MVSLRNLGPDDARAFLRAAGVADDLHDEAIGVTHGHPLALSLLLDVLSQRREGSAAPLGLDAVPDVVERLLTCFAAEVPSPRHRLALEVAAHAGVATQGLLRGAIGEAEGEELFAWLRGLSFVEVGPRGLVVHDLAREALDADLRWRDRAAYAACRRGAPRRRRAAARCEGRERQRRSPT